MPVANNPSDEQSHPDYSQLGKEQSTNKPRPTTNNQQSENRSTATTGYRIRQDSLDAKPHTGERDSRKDLESRSTATTTARPIHQERPYYLQRGKEQSH